MSEFMKDVVAFYDSEAGTLLFTVLPLTLIACDRVCLSPAAQVLMQAVISSLEPKPAAAAASSSSL